MNWDRLLSVKRLGMEEYKTGDMISDRPQFQRDYDRIIFSSPFRRMQSKTQVFPLPGRIFIHNRLTHSLEVASVGRSFGNLLSEHLVKEKKTDNELVHEIGSVVSAACLAHDMGNPPFGHSGESAISDFFSTSPGADYLKEMNDSEQKDFTIFDGNANVFRLLTHRFKGKRPGGFALTYTTLASIIKYPYESAFASHPKFGFFHSEKEIFLKVATELGMPVTTEKFMTGARHPLVYFTEAADDICYQIMDLEDAYKLGILTFNAVKDLYLGFYDPQSDAKILDSIKRTLAVVTDPNEQISYLRAGLIGKLIQQCFNIFLNNYKDIMQGNFRGSLIRNLEGTTGTAIQEVKRISLSQVYNHRSVVEIEIAGFKILRTLLDEFTGAIIYPESSYSKKILSLLPDQFQPESSSTYHRIQAVVDFVSGMTDHFALEMYRKIKGISLPEIG